MPVNGSVALTAGDVSRAEVILTNKNIDGAAEVYAYKADLSGGDFVAGAAPDGTYILEATPPGEYTLLIRKPGALYYQKLQFVVGAEAVTVDSVTLTVGDLNLDGIIDDGDLGTLIDGMNFNRVPTADGVLAIADLNNDESIDDGDLGVLIEAVNFNKAAMASENK